MRVSVAFAAEPTTVLAMRVSSHSSFVVASLSLVSLAALAALGVACSSDPATAVAGNDSGVDGGKVTGDSGKEASVDPDDSGAACKLKQKVSTNATCNTCAEENCCAEVNGCAAEKDCQAFITCAADCLNDAGVSLDGGGDGGVDAGSAQGCLVACQKAHKTGATAYQGFAACIRGSCKMCQ